MKKYNSLPYQQQKGISNDLKFETIQEHLNSLYGKIDKMSTVDEMENFVKQNESYLKMVRNTEGEQEIVPVGITKHSVKTFLNKDRIIKVGNKYLKYIFDFAVESDNYEDLLPLSSVEKIQNSGFKFHVAFKKLENTLGTRDLGTYIKDWTTHDPSWCKNDRRITMDAGIYVTFYPLPSGGFSN